MNKTIGMQPAREHNIQEIAAYFESGVKAAGEPGRLGVELEHIVTTDKMEPVGYSDDHGVAWVLEQLSQDYPNKTYDEDGNIIGVARPGEAVTIEPAGQLELSAGPFEDIGQIREDFEAFERYVAHVLKPDQVRTLAVGYHPSAKAEELELIDKTRYQLMDAYFARIGDFGRCMMRGSAATQISIDYYSEEDCLRKMRLASALAPAFSLVCDNSPKFEGAVRTHHLQRTEIWRECDPDRCGIVPGLMDADFSWRRYAEYVLDTPAILVPDGFGDWRATDRTFGEEYAETPMERADVEHALSMLFNDVRLKTYIEIRPADAMPVPFVVAYAALIKGLFYDADNLETLDTMFADITVDSIEEAKTDLMAHGYQGTAYGRPVAELVDELFEMAHDALPSNETSYLSALSNLVSRRLNLASMADPR